MIVSWWLDSYCDCVVMVGGPLVCRFVDCAGLGIDDWNDDAASFGGD